MSKFLNLWTKQEKFLTETETMSKLLIKSNEMFKLFLNNYSWFVYLFAGSLVLCCICYYIFDCKRRLDLRRHRENSRRANERIPQRRRPGAIYREHEIFRNAIKRVHQYIGMKEKQGPTEVKSNVLRRTRSGVVYGSFSDNVES